MNQKLDPARGTIELAPERAPNLAPEKTLFFNDKIGIPP